MSTAEKTTAQIIWDAIEGLHQQGQVATRELLCELTGLKMTIVDDHVGRMIESGRLRRLRAGVFAPIAAMPEPRAVSTTDMPDGTVLLEIGDVVLHLWPREYRALAKRLVGDAVQYSNIQAGVEAGTLATELAADLLATKREMSARIQDLERQLNAAVRGVAPQPTPQMSLLQS
ncbi:hypothetical protein [Acidovorax sp. SUPP2539]|uniref:hypothetical protein n=1 Tax=Acidovorax sp. SUPP2539 TaxID=2920878 RepID=UPI0023DE1D20|nr:hypothetical protein [Acidovorax sp. SUPP2539]GKS91209.1 hypothetical protein AVTE2539_17610 [Acidovorax sp. SUPP2539]